MDKAELILKITSYHPASKAGIDNGWSHYTGGMKDSGDWYYIELLKANIEVLEALLESLQEDWAPKPEKVYTKEELLQMKNIQIQNSGLWMNEYQVKQFEKMVREYENKKFGL